jgi:hypothetical protein
MTMPPEPVINLVAFIAGAALCVLLAALVAALLFLLKGLHR